MTPTFIDIARVTSKTLRDKALNLWEINKVELGISFDDFYGNIIFYGMTKYIFSRILYGKFDINFLLQKYNETFLKDLGSSRFCSFLEIFLDPASPIFGYNQYFKNNKN